METYNSFEEVIEITNIHQKYQRMNKNNMCYFVIGDLQPVHIAKETTGVCLSVHHSYLRVPAEVPRGTTKKWTQCVLRRTLCVTW